MRKGIVTVAVSAAFALSAIVFFPGSTVPVSAATFPDGTSKLCLLPNGAYAPEANNPSQTFAGLTTPVPVFPGYQISYNPAVIQPLATAAYNLVMAAAQNGVPGITPADAQNAALFNWKLVAYHECTHARTGAGTTMEVAVNCTAVLSMLNDGVFSQHDVDVQTFIYSQPQMGSIAQPWQYGGSLGAFWAETIACVNWAQQNPGVAPPANIAPALALDPL